MSNSYLSQERYNEVSETLKKLKTEGRQNVAERLKQSKELGDLSENSDYQEAREEQSRLERKIAELEELLKTASIIKKSEGNSAHIRVGSKISVKKNGNEKIQYVIVGSSEASPADGLISNESPVGKNLLGKKVGDKVSVKTPAGEVPYEILAIE